MSHQINNNDRKFESISNPVRPFEATGHIAMECQNTSAVESAEDNAIIEHLQAERDYDDATRECECGDPGCVECHAAWQEQQERAHYAQRDCERGQSDDIGDDSDE